MSRVFRSAIAAAAVGSALLGSAAVAAAEPANCTPADLAGVQAGVNASMSAYLFAHPDVNMALDGVDALPKAERHTKLQAFFDSNPTAKADITGIRQPVVDFKARCGQQGQ